MATSSDEHVLGRRAVASVGLAGIGTAAAGVAGLRYAERGPDSLRLSAAPMASSALGDGTVDVRLDRSVLPRVARGVRRTQRMPTAEFSMVGFTWRGALPVISIRTRTGGRWTAWQVMPHLHDLPDPETLGQREGDPDLLATEPLWVGRCTGIQVRVADPTPGSGGVARHLTMALIDPGSPLSDRVVSARGASGVERRGGSRKKASKPNHAPRPPMFTRTQWGADEGWRDGSPRYIRSIQQVHIHHTATGNDYDPADVPALIRGMYRYHTANLGWSDIGYNFLVDRYGRIWTGRAGGAGLPVRGAHTLGFNATSAGISVIGNYDQVRPTRAALTAIVHLAAWKLDKYHRKPAGWTRVYSEGSDRFRPGRSVVLPVLDGHRDTNETSCPGQHLYNKLPGLRRRTQARVRRFNPPKKAAPSQPAARSSKR